MIANFQSNPVLTTIITYAQCEYEDEVVNNTFFEQLLNKYHPTTA